MNINSVFQGRITRRIAIINITLFVLLVTAVITAVQITGRQTLNQYTDFVKSALIDNFERELQEPIEDVINISTGVAMRDYARLVLTTPSTNFNSTEEQLQVQLIRELDNLIRGHSGRYLEAQYITRAGRVMVSVESIGLTSRIELEPEQISLTEDPILSAIFLQGEPGVPFLGPLQPPNADYTVETIDIYVPINILGGTSQVVGMIHLKLDATSLLAVINDAFSDPLIEQSGRRILLVDNENRIVETSSAGINTSGILASLAQNPEDDRWFLNPITLISTGTITAFDGLTHPWRIVVVDNILTTSIIVGPILIFIMALVLTWIGLWLMNLLMNPLFQPIIDATGLLRRFVERGDVSPEAFRTEGNRHQDEFGQILSDMGGVVDRIDGLRNELNRQNIRYERDMQVVSYIGREMATLNDIDTLLNRAINLVAEEFDHYHAQVFLVDDVGANAVLAHSRGAAGQKLLEANYKIPIGSETVIGRVTARGYPVIVNDTTKRDGTPHRFNPMLPETRAEVGLPLFVGGEVIGVLDIQSKQPNAFQQSDLPALLLVADQLAVAIHHARIANQTDKRIQQIDSLNRQLTRAAWEEADQRVSLERKYRYNLLDVSEGSGITDAETENSSSILTSPIRIRGEVIGDLKAEPMRGQEFTEGDEIILRSVAERVALAIENARLFQETQASLTETSTLYQLSRYLNEADTLEDIIQAVVFSVMPDAVAGQVWIFDEFHASRRPEWVEITASLIAEQPDTEMVGTRLYVPDHALLDALEPDQITLVNDISEDSRMDETVQRILTQMQARSSVIIPLSVGGRWRGVIVMGFKEIREFTEREGRIYVALIDQAGVAIDNRLLLKQTEEEVARNENLYAASRLINTAQDMPDLVYAAVATTSDHHLNFVLSLLEGKLDETGWPARARIVAMSDSGSTHVMDLSHDLNLPASSPMRNREPEVITDRYHQSDDLPQQFAWLRAQDNKFIAAFPLFSANQPIALFYIISKQQHELSLADYEVYRALTGQMSSQIQVRQFLERTEIALDETRRLYVASSAIAAAQDLPTVYEVAVEHLARPFVSLQSSQTFQVALVLAKPAPVRDAPYVEFGLTWSSVADRPYPFGTGQRIEQALFPIGSLMQDGMVHLPDVHPDHESLVAVPAFFDLLQQHGVNSFLAVPIRTRESWYGAVLCQCDQPLMFNEQYTRFVTAIAEQLAIVIDRQILFEQARLEAERAQAEAQRNLALAEAARLASRIGDNFDKSLREVFERVAVAGGFDRWMLLLEETPGGKDFRTIASIPRIDDPQEYFHNLQGNLPIMDAMRLDRSFVVNEPTSYPGVSALLPDNQKDILQFFGKHVAYPVRVGGRAIGAMFMGRSMRQPDLDERDQQLVETLSAQVSIAHDNRQLFETVRREQRTIRTILETLPAGVLVLHPDDLRPIMFNEQAQTLLGQEIDPTIPFSIEAYNMYRTGTLLQYPHDEMPIFAALRDGEQKSMDDVAVVNDDIQIDLLVDAAPLRDEYGNITAIVAAFQDISNLRSMESTLQENLRETVQLYDAQRQLTETREIGEVLDVLIMQLAATQPTDAYILMMDEHNTIQQVRELVQPLEQPELLVEVLDSYEMVRISDVMSARLEPITRDYLLDLGIHSLVTVPLRASTRDKTLGWTVLMSSEVNGFPVNQEPFLTQLNDMASTTLDNRILIQTQDATLREIQSVYRANAAISRSRNVEDLTQALHDALNDMSPDYFSAYVDRSTGVDVENEMLFNYAASGLQPIDFVAILKNYELPPYGLYVDDLQALNFPDETEQRLIDAGIRGITAIHIRPNDLPEGFLVAAYANPHRFSDAENRYMNTIADGASIIFNNSILFQRIQDSLTETSTLYQASRSLSQSTTPEEIVQIVTDHLIGPHVNQVFIALLNTRRWTDSNATVQVVASWHQQEGVDLRGVTLSADQFPAWDQLATKEVLAINDILMDERLTPMEQVGIESLDARSLVVIPLGVPNRAIGAVWIGSRVPHKHLEREIRNYQAFREQASLSLEASYLLQQTERRAAQLQTSSQVSQTASTILDLNILLPRLVSLIQESFHYDHVQIFLMDDKEEHAMLRASTGEAGKQLLAINWSLRKGSESVIGQVTATGLPSIALDTADANVVHQPNAFLPLTRSEMALPIIIKGRVAGALDVQSNQPNAFSDEDIQALTTLAGQIAVAIENANLYEATDKQASNMRFLFEVTNYAASAQTLDEAVNNIVGSLQTDLRASAVAVYLPRVYMDDFDNTMTTMRAASLVGSDRSLAELDEMRLDDDSHLFSIIADTLQPYIIRDIHSEVRYRPLRASARSAALLPLSSSGDLIGVIVMEDDQYNAYDDEMLRILRTLMRALSGVVQSFLLLDQLNNTVDQLRELDRIKSDFLANMSHELRTPLNSIIGFSRVMLKGIDGPLTEMQEQDLTTIYNSGQHLLMLINDVLDQAKIAAGKLDIKLAYFEVKPLIEAVKSIGVGLVKDKPINLMTEISPNLPKLYGDDFRTRQVLLNLVSNASKFTESGAIVIRAFPTTDQQTGRSLVQIEVQDTGIGIAEKDLPLLFEAFRQVDSSLTRTQGGTGLGLPIARSLVELQGGTMFVHSEVNVGSTFAFTIPTQPQPEKTDEDDKALPEAHNDETVELEPRPSTNPTIEVRSLRNTAKLMSPKREILLIEDDKNMVDQFRRALQREGFDVQTADHPAYAEAMASNLRPNVIVMDVNFANGQGWDILKSLKDRDDTFDIPIIVVTLNNDSERAYQLGAYRFIQRPFVPEDLVGVALEAEKESNTERILIIDDQPEAIRLLTQLLNENGTYRVFSAENGTEGISMVARRRPDLIILDLRMPEKDGFAVLQELRSNPETANIPVMVVTGELDFKAEERQQLDNIRVLHKTNISEEEFEQFITDVRNHLNLNGES